MGFRAVGGTDCVKPARIARFDGTLRDELGGQVKIQFFGSHRRAIPRYWRRAVCVLADSGAGDVVGFFARVTSDARATRAPG